MADLTSAMQKKATRQGANSIEMTTASPKLRCQIKRAFKSNGNPPRSKRKMV